MQIDVQTGTESLKHILILREPGNVSRKKKSKEYIDGCFKTALPKDGRGSDGRMYSLNAEDMESIPGIINKGAIKKS